MRPVEATVMRLWLQQHEDEYDRFDYNVRVGPGRDPGPSYSDSVRKTAIMSSQLRLDAVGWKGDRPTLIEVKNYALVTAVAQLTLYAAVWQLERPSGPNPGLVIVCTNAEPGVGNAAVAAGVALQVVKAH
jgi:hypothetical protein